MMRLPGMQIAGNNERNKIPFKPKKEIESIRIEEIEGSPKF